MNKCGNRLVLSSIHIEPVDSHEYNKNLVETLTPYHKQKFLQFVRTERSFLNDPGKYTTLPDRLVKELNKQNQTNGEREWLRIFRAWIDLVSNTSTNRVLFTEDLILLRYISSTQPRKIVSTKISKSNPLKDLTSRCRICLASSSTKMLSLFKESMNKSKNSEEKSLLEKLNYCSCFTSKAQDDDHLPKYICMSCSILVENAYQLKVLCAKTEERYSEMIGRDCQMKGVKNIVHIKIEQNKTGSNNAKKNSRLEEEIMNMQIEIVDNENVGIANKPDDTQQEAQNIADDFEPEREENISKIDKTNEDSRKNSIKSREYQCDICAAVFSFKQSLRHHMLHKHMGEAVRKKPYPCTQCDKRFRIKNALTIHLRSHTGERPYTCEICGKAFKTTSAASSHRVVHTEAKDFQCSSCEFSTNTKANLRIHERTHSGVQPYTCQFCPMKFRTASNVVKHMRNIHEKQKTNKCDKCDRSFFTKESLRKHSITHTGLKPFKCPKKECSVSYVWYNGLKKHIQQQHSDENVKIPTEKVFFEKLKNILTT